MKDIEAILSGFQLSDEDRDTIIKEVGENYRSIVEVTKKSQRIEELESQNKALTEQVGNLEGDGEELEKLRKQVSDYEAAEEKRKADETEATKREQFRVVFDAALDGKEFANEMIRETVFSKAYKECGNNAAINAKDAIEQLTKDMDGIWKNPHRDVNRMPSQDELSQEKDHDVKSAEREILNFMAGR